MRVLSTLGENKQAAGWIAGADDCEGDDGTVEWMSSGTVEM